MNWSRATVLLTGGTGSFGRRFLERPRPPRRIVIFSRDEHKQHALRRAGLGGPRVSWIVGDVRDASALREALEGVDAVIHAAALKQVPLGEAQPEEFILTNLLGALNLVDAARAAGVSRVLALGTDKAVNPVNVYGATKLLAERVFLAADARRGRRPTRFAGVRYGNVLGSRGSVLDDLAARPSRKRIPITDERMTRFWMPLEAAVEFAVESLLSMKGGEIFIPRMRGARVADLVLAAAPGARLEPAGRRPGEKIHELLIAEDEAPYAVEERGRFVLRPWTTPRGGRPFRGTRYASDSAERFSADELRRLTR